MGNAAATPRKPSPVTVHDVELVNLLWQLKQQYQQRSGNCVPLTMLLNDPDYRLSVLQAAADADEPGLAALAAEIAALLEARQTPPRPTPPSAPPSQPARRRLPWWLGASALACLILLAGLALLGPRQAAEETASVAAAAATGPQKKPLPAQLPPPALRLHGSNTIGEQLAPALVEGILRTRGYTDIRLVPGTTSTDKTVYAFAQDDLPEIAVEIHAHGSSTAFQGLMAGSADLGMASRPILDREVTALQPQLGNLTAVGSEHVIALDGLAVIVHPSNPVHSLSTRQVAQLFSGQIANWNSLGGPELPVTVYARDDQSGTFETFKSLVLKPHGAQLTPSAHRIESSSELSDRVAQDPGAIGFIGLPYVRRAKVLAINESEQALAIVPTHFTVATEDYPLSRRLYFYLPAVAANPLAVELIEFTLGETGQEIVAQAGFVSQNIRSEDIALDPSLPIEYLELARGSRRLSLNFRFQPGSDQLDNKALRDLDRLVAYLKEHPSLRVALIGFTDGSHEPSYNMLLSQRRAEAIERALQARGVFPWATRGFGAVAPLAADTSPAGQHRNRRVEVWVR